MTTEGRREVEQPVFGEVLGAPDHLPIERQLDIALESMAAMHAEIDRLVQVANEYRRSAENTSGADVAESRVSRPQRLRSAWRRRGTLGTVRFLRTVAWIVLKSPRGRRAEVATPRSGTPSPLVTSPFAGDRPIRDRLRSGAHDEAHVLVRALVPAHRGNVNFLGLAREVETKRGSLSVVLALTNAISTSRTVAPESLRVLEGRLREVSGWYPRIAGPLVPIEDADPSAVVHLCKESRPYLSNGFTTRSQRNFEAVAAAGMVTTVITEPGFPWSVGVEDAALQEDVGGVTHRRIDLGPDVARRLPFDRFLEIFANDAYRIVQEERPSILHVSSGRRGYDTPLVALAIKKKTGLPLVYEFRSFFEGTWTADIDYGERGETFQRRLEVEAMCLDAADAVVTLSESMSDELVRMGCAREKIHIVPNGVDVDRFVPVPRSAALARRFDLEGCATFGYVSNMDHPRESQDTLIRAMAVLRERGARTKCVLVGDGVRRAELEELARTLGVEESVVFTGAVDHESILDYYGLIDLFVVPRTTERAGRLVTPLKPFEAMSMEIPVIVSDVPALREIVAAPSRGFTYPAGDHEQLAQTIEQLVADPSPARAAAREAARWVRAERRWEMNGERYRAAFEFAKESARR